MHVTVGTPWRLSLREQDPPTSRLESHPCRCDLYARDCGGNPKVQTLCSAWGLRVGLRLIQIRPSWSLAAVVLVISLGLGLLVAGETEFNLAGFVIVMVASALSGLRWTITQVLLQGSEAHGTGADARARLLGSLLARVLPWTCLRHDCVVPLQATCSGTGFAMHMTAFCSAFFTNQGVTPGVEFLAHCILVNLLLLMAANHLCTVPGRLANL